MNFKFNDKRYSNIENIVQTNAYVPGSGKYNPDHKLVMESPIFYKISQADMPKVKPLVKTNAPAPGQYNTMNGFEKNISDKSNKNFSFNKTIRESEFSSKPRKNKVPGPGHYKKVENGY